MRLRRTGSASSQLTATASLAGAAWKEGEKLSGRMAELCSTWDTTNVRCAPHVLMLSSVQCSVQVQCSPIGLDCCCVCTVQSTRGYECYLLDDHGNIVLRLPYKQDAVRHTDADSHTHAHTLDPHSTHSPSALVLTLSLSSSADTRSHCT